MLARQMTPADQSSVSGRRRTDLMTFHLRQSWRRPTWTFKVAGATPSGVASFAANSNRVVFGVPVPGSTPSLLWPVVPAQSQTGSEGVASPGCSHCTPSMSAASSEA